MRRQNPLANSSIGDLFHLGQTWQCGCAGIGDERLVLLRRNVAKGKTRIVVSRSNNTVEIEFACV